MKLIIIDNYDSFVYNIAQLFGKLNIETEVYRNDKISLRQIEKINPDGIVISPGPGHPADQKYFGECNNIIKTFGKDINILGICLGHQGIVSVYGGRVINAKKTRHGKTSKIIHQNEDILENIENPFNATRYHSLIADIESIPNCLKIIARSADDNEIMAIKHKKFPIRGVQFHPESILTKEGLKLLHNFKSMIKK
ncbi:MAG: anthranilate synthase component II [Nitrososphaeraceae archaeon]